MRHARHSLALLYFSFVYQEVDKTKGLLLQLEQESQKRSILQHDQSALSAEVSMLKSRERQLQRELEAGREVARGLEEELHKYRAGKSVDDLQMRELQEQYEAEQYFSTLYKSQVSDLREEMDEKTKLVSGLAVQCTIWLSLLKNLCAIAVSGDRAGG